MERGRKERGRNRLDAAAVRRALRNPALWVAPVAGAVALAFAAPRADGAVERYALPITAPSDQGDTGLCWVFAALSMIETNYMSRHPGEAIDLSRAALQRAAIADRFRRMLAGEPGRLSDGGLAVEALALIRADGLVARADFHDVVASSPAMDAIREALTELTDSNASVGALDGALRATLGEPPRQTHLGPVAVAPRTLARAVIGDRRWVEYDRADGDAQGWGPSRDPDARPETRVLYVPLDRMVRLVHDSLKRGEAVVAGTADHARLIYGAEYDRGGRPIAYLIKDSLAPFQYRLSAEDLHSTLTDVTVVDNAAPAA